jgi:GDP-L-fucose synthase
VIPGLIYRLHDAKINNLESVTIWGTGNPKREFLYVDDLAQASIHIMNLDKKIYNEKKVSLSSYINVGSTKELTIKELAETIKEVINFKGKINFDPSKPDGAHRKWIDSGCLNRLGWVPKVNLEDGLRSTYLEFIAR